MFRYKYFKLETSFNTGIRICLKKKIRDWIISNPATVNICLMKNKSAHCKHDSSHEVLDLVVRREGISLPQSPEFVQDALSYYWKVIVIVSINNHGWYNDGGGGVTWACLYLFRDSSFPRASFWGDKCFYKNCSYFFQKIFSVFIKIWEYYKVLSKDEIIL